MDNLIGITAADWLHLLRENRFAVDRAFWPRALAVTRISLGNTADRRKEERRYGAELANVQSLAPLFVLGHWRSGTTLLHELLILDQQFAYPNLFQVAHPHTCLIREKAVARALADAPPQKRPMDNMEVTYRSPGEDEQALAVLSLRSPLIAWSFARREAFYDRFLTFRDVPQADVERWKRALLNFVRKLTWKYKRPLVLKSPTHTGRIKLILQLFPTARFVHVHRDPYAVFQSTRRLYEKAVAPSYLQQPDPAQLDTGILRRYKLMYDAFFEERSLIPAGQFCEIGFEALERDPVAQMANVYEQLRLDGFDQVQPQVQQYLDARSSYQKNEHPALAEPLRQGVAQSWRRSFEAWGYVA